MSTLESGRRVGRYKVLRFLGAGAMGEVYLAEDPHIERRLAIKTVRLAGGRPLDIEDRKKRLLREARAAGRLLHPNVVALFDAGEEEGLLYLAFEFVEGCDLASRLEAGPPPTLREVLRITRQVADALDYAHRQGIVHRDIKPSNILIDNAGHVKVADFGIAKVAGQTTELTVAGSVMGSPQYLSPEQIRGDELDGRSDIFSLGVVLYELLSGRRPFDGETITTLVYQILHKDPSISELRAVPPRIEQLLRHMLAKDREARIATAALVAEELAAIEREMPAATLDAAAAPADDVLDKTRVLASRSMNAVAYADAPAMAPASTAAPPSPAAPALAGSFPAAPSPAVPPAGYAPVPAATPAPVPQPPSASGRFSGARLWLLLGGVVVVLGVCIAVSGYWLWQRYLHRGGEETVATAGGPPPASPPSELSSTASSTPSTGAPQAAPLPSPVPVSQPPREPAAPGAPAAPAATGPPLPSPPLSSQPRPPASPPSRPSRTASPGHTASPAVSGGSSTAATAGGSSSPAAAGGVEPPAYNPAAAVPPAPPSPTAPSAIVPTAPAAPPGPAAESADRVLHSGLELAFRINPPDAYVLLDGGVIGRAEEWSGEKGNRPFLLPGPGPHLVKIRKPGMKDYRITVEASSTRGVTQVAASLQPLPAAQVDTSDLQTVRVREAVALHLQPEVDATVQVDGTSVGPAKRYAGRFGHPDEWLALPPGVHRVSVIAAGFTRRDLAVEITPGAERARQKVDVPMSREAGN